MLNEILALRTDASSSKLYPVHSGSLTLATELPAETPCLAATSASQVHQRTRIRHLSDPFHKVRKSVALLHISSKHVELRRGPGRKRIGTNYLQRSCQLIKKKKIQKMNARQCSPAAHARFSMFKRHPNIAWAGFGPLEHAG